MNKEELINFCNHKLEKVSTINNEYDKAVNERVLLYKDLSSKLNEKLDQWQNDYSAIAGELFENMDKLSEDYTNYYNYGEIGDIIMHCTYISPNNCFTETINNKYYIQCFIEKISYLNNYYLGFNINNNIEKIGNAYQYDGGLTELYITTEKTFSSLVGEHEKSLLKIFNLFDKESGIIFNSDDAIECVNYILENGERLITEQLTRTACTMENLAKNRLEYA